MKKGKERSGKEARVTRQPKVYLSNWRNWLCFAFTSRFSRT